MTRRAHPDRGVPLLEWGEQLRALRLRRRRLVRRAGALLAGITVLVLTAIWPPAPRLVWNASASAPIGLYVISPGAALNSGEMVIARTPILWRRLADRRHYVPAGVPLVKRVAAVAGDDVCADGPAIFINGKWAAGRYATDKKGRRMPWWTGCVRLRQNQYFVLMPEAPASFDGRYFGISDGRDIIGRARLLWSR
jgi:conjugative transfer signal peptidase TraF